MSMKARDFYGIFYQAALRIAANIDDEPVCVKCVAGMNRSSTS